MDDFSSYGIDTDMFDVTINNLNSGADGILGVVVAFMSVFIIFFISILIFKIVYNWKIYKKAGLDGWESIIPIYNIIVKFKFLNIPLWILVLYIVPGAGALAVNIIVSINMARKFNKPDSFAIGLVLLPIVFNPIIAFGKSEYDLSIPGVFEDARINQATKNLRYCRYCGKPIAGEFCSNCGKKDE